MRHLKASAFQRLIAYFIDFLILTTISDLILKLVGPLVPGYDPDLLLSKYNLFMEQLASNLEINYELINQIMTLAIIQLLLSIAIMIPLVILYFCVLGYYWSRQTVGRALMGLKLVNNNEEESKVSFPRLLLREVVGSFIITYVLSTSFLIPIIVLIYLAVTKRMVFADYIAKTKLIDARFVLVDNRNEELFNNNFSNHDYMDAEFKDVKTYDDSHQQAPSSDDEEEYHIF